MFSAHLIFGDINNHSNLPMAERIETLEKFWNSCNDHKPQDLNNLSFYETDNDSFMAGFSDQNGFFSGYDVINFVTSLHKSLFLLKINVSFGINLLACKKTINWKTCNGFVDNQKYIYIKDESYNESGKVQRSKLVGDALIVTARLQSLAKTLKVPGCISIFNGGHVNELNGHVLKSKIKLRSEKVTNKLYLLEKQHESWLKERNIDVFTLEY